MPVSSLEIRKCMEILIRFGATKIILFGSALEAPDEARDLDLGIDGIEGWDIFRAGAEAEKEIGIPLDLIPLTPPTRFTVHIEHKGRVLHDSR